MDLSSCGDSLPSDVLLDIISVQTGMVKLGVDLSGVMDYAADQILRLTHAAGAIIELAEGEDMVYRAASGIAGAQLGLRLKRASSLSGLCVEQMRTLHCEDSETDRRVDREACRKVGLRSMVVAPLSHLGKVVGAMKIVSPHAGYFTERHVCILGIMSQMVAASMHFSEKYETAELYRKATRDVLTGLANRSLFYDRLRQCMASARRRSRCVGVLNIDMDGLKHINDTHGHRAGDAAIREFARRASGAVRDADTVARLGGDEFGVVLSDIRGREDIQAAMDRIQDSAQAPFSFEELPLRIEASVGGALFPEDGEGPDGLIETADKLMYRNKQAKKQTRAVA